MNNKENKLVINRPLVFLCGPAFNKDNPFDRRKLTADYIKDKSPKGTRKRERNVFRLVPIIVDNIFDDPFIKDYSLSLKTMEEIVAEVAYRTYIFLDTMSTSYELGLFDTFRADNQINVFLEDRKYNENNYVGEYVKKSISTNPKSKIHEYFPVKDEKQYLHFKNNEIPDEVKKVIDKDFDNLYERLKDGAIVPFVATSKRKANEISFLKMHNEINFYLGIKLAFYLAINLLSKKYIDDVVQHESFKEAFECFKSNIVDLYITSPHCPDSIEFILKRPECNLFFGNDGMDAELVFKHIICILYKISISEGDKNIRTGRLYRPDFKSLRQINVADQLLSIKDYQLNIIKRFYKNKNDFLEKRIIVTSGKKRQIITYKNNRNGRELRKMHEQMASRLYYFFPPHECSFAYKNGASIKDCILKHINSKSFIKLDIHSFFNSINKGKLVVALRERINKELKVKAPKNISLRTYSTYLKPFIDICAYSSHLPLGLVTSPILSDIYMNSLDFDFSKFCKKDVYTRYADDILISNRSSKHSFDNELEKLISLLLEKGLTVNQKKKAVVKFNNEGDSIHYVGINIVYKKDGSILTISKKYLEEYTKTIARYEKDLEKNEEKVIGIINYVKLISFQSFSKLQSIYLRKFKKELPYTK